MSLNIISGFRQAGSALASIPGSICRAVSGLGRSVKASLHSDVNKAIRDGKHVYNKGRKTYSLQINGKVVDSDRKLMHRIVDKTIAKLCMKILLPYTPNTNPIKTV
jgi:hypothetical protein